MGRGGCHLLFFRFKKSYLFLAAWGLHYYTWAFSSVACGGYSLLQCRNFSSQWDILNQGLNSMSPALAGRLLTTGPPGKSQGCHSIYIYFFFQGCHSNWVVREASPRRRPGRTGKKPCG